MVARIQNRRDLLDADGPGGPGEALTARRARLLDAFEAALAAVDAEGATRAALREETLSAGLYVLAFGKAARGMARAALDLEPVGGFVVDTTGADLGVLSGRLGGHPVPHPRAADVGREVLDWARRRGPEDTVLCLVSGGGSSMLELPVDGLSLDEVVARTRAHLRGGSDISTTNAARREWSLLKGGKLAAAMAPARVVNLVLSDVAPHGPELVASGPTVAPGVSTRIVADGLTAAAAAAHALRVDVAREPLEGEARVLGRSIVRGPDGVWFGEPRVTVAGQGRGGRCRELALAALPGIGDGVLLAAGTDGVDGVPGGAGAIVDAATLRAAGRRGLDPTQALADNDSATFFEGLGATVITGPTGTNVADLVLYLSSSATATSPR